MASFADDEAWGRARWKRLQESGGTDDRVRRADDRRTTANSETPGRSKANFSGGYHAQLEAKLTGADDVGQGKGRAREQAWGGNRGSGGWTPPN